MGQFLDELQMRRPLFGQYIDHRNLRDCNRLFAGYARLLPQETIILHVGPSNVGKSTALAYFVSTLIQETFRDAPADSVPVIGVNAQTSREGRTAPKFVIQSLLEDVNHPFFQQVEMQERGATYLPSIRMDETRSLRALRTAMHLRKVDVVIVDEAQHIVRAKDENFRASLLESLKSLVTPRTTLVMAGSYELADVALQYRSHVAARKLIVHMPRYSESNDDMEEWGRILASFAQLPTVQLSSDEVLMRRSRSLLEECHGIVGVLEKRLYDAMIRSIAEGSPGIADAHLIATAPTTAEWQTIRNDVEHGEKLLGKRLSAVALDEAKNRKSKRSGKGEAKSKDAAKKVKSKPDPKKAKPFQRRPTRTQAGVKV